MKQLTKETIKYIEKETGQTVDQFCLGQAGELVDKLATEIEQSGIPQEDYIDNLIIQANIYIKAAAIIEAMLSLDESKTKH